MEEWEIRYEEDLQTLTHSGTTVFTEKQKLKNIELRDAVRDLLPIDDDHKVSDCDLLYRFLIGKKWNCEVARESLREYVKFRKEERINGILAELPHPQIAPILAVIYGVDKEGHPVIWMSPEHATLMSVLKSFDKKVLLRAQIQTMERSRFLARARGVDRCTYVIDFKKITFSSVNSTTLGFLKSMNKMLQDLYPEIISHIFIFNAGWVIVKAWKLLLPFVDSRVQEKVKFFNVSPSPESLRELVEPEEILPVFGGTGSIDVMGGLVKAEETRLRAALLTDSSPETNAAASPLGRIPTPQESPRSRRIASSEGNFGAPTETFLADVLVIHEPAQRSPSVPTSGALNATTSSGEEYAGFASDASFCSCRSTLEESERERKAETANSPPGSPTVRLELRPTVEAGTLVGYSEDRCIGMFSRGRVYCEVDWPTSNSPRAVPKSESNAALVVEDSPKMLSLKLAPLESALPTQGWVFGGELLRESKHPIHSYVIICDAMRNARFVLKKSILRRQLTIFRIVGNSSVMTSPTQKHSVKGKHLKVAVVVPTRSNAPDDGRWMILSKNSSGEKLSKWFLPKRFMNSSNKPTVGDPWSRETAEFVGGSPTSSHEISSEKNGSCGSSGVIGFFEKDIAFFQGPLASNSLPISFLMLVSIRLMWDKMRNIEEYSSNT
ncbi:unnamed protein product [Phytomonas sp. EM1]|nr:unnamed protein product [Phytomonas sp. EM1]|eukprot:CCW65666.1 unnamed protein product [Phytomonas sp. isolate EM1]